MADLLATAKVAFQAIIEEHRMPDSDVIKLLVSQLLGYAILAGACITKLPQILIIWQARSAQGLSVEMFEIETYTLLVSALYGFSQALPFNTYGESLILVVQNVLILALVYHFSSTGWLRRTAVMAAYVALVLAVVQGHIDTKTMTNIAEANTLVVIVSRLPQVFKNFAAKSTGTLSGITAAINVVGCLVRVFTTLQAKAGAAMLRSYLTSLLINGMLVVQIIMYKKNTAAALKAQKDKAAAEATGKKKQ